MAKYWAVMKNKEFVLCTLESDTPDAYETMKKQAYRWSLHYPDDRITIEPLARRAQAEQKSQHGHTEARGWEAG